MTGLKPSTNVSELIRLPPRMLEPAAGMRSAQCRLRHRNRNGHEEHEPELDYLRAANKRSQTVVRRPESASWLRPKVPRPVQESADFRIDDCGIDCVERASSLIAAIDEHSEDLLSSAIIASFRDLVPRGGAMLARNQKPPAAEEFTAVESRHSDERRRASLALWEPCPDAVAVAAHLAERLRTVQDAGLRADVADLVMEAACAARPEESEALVEAIRARGRGVAFNGPAPPAIRKAVPCRSVASPAASRGSIPRTNHGQTINGPTAAPGDRAIYLH